MFAIYNRYGQIVGYVNGNKIYDFHLTFLGIVEGNNVLDPCCNLVGYLVPTGIYGWPAVFACDGTPVGYIIGNVITSTNYSTLGFVEVERPEVLVGAAGLLLLL